MIFQNHAYIKNLERSPSISAEMSKFVTQRHESPLIFGTRKLVVFMGSTSLDRVVDVIADVARMLYFVSKLTLVKMYLGSGQLFRRSMIERIVGICTVLSVNFLK